MSGTGQFGDKRLGWWPIQLHPNFATLEPWGFFFVGLSLRDVTRVSIYWLCMVYHAKICQKKVPHSFFSRNHDQGADSVHNKLSNAKESPWMNPRSEKQEKFILRINLQMSIPWGSAIDSTLEERISMRSRDSLSNWRASPTGCLYLMHNGDFLPYSRDSGMNGNSGQETVRMYEW